jgi:hypothetical protein
MCDVCNENLTNNKIEVKGLCWYLNKSTKQYVCSDKCKKEFIDKYICAGCGLYTKNMKMINDKPYCTFNVYTPCCIKYANMEHIEKIQKKYHDIYNILKDVNFDTDPIGFLHYIDIFHEDYDEAKILKDKMQELIILLDKIIILKE